MAAGLATTIACAFSIAALPSSASAATPGYDLVFEENFSRGGAAGGSWDTSPYNTRFAAYDQFLEQNVGPARYSKDALSVHDGRLDMFGYTRPRGDGTTEPVASAIVPLIDGKYQGFTYGRYEFTLAVEPVGSDGMDKWSLASLLWPDSDKASDGEIDFPEAQPGGQLAGYVHDLGDRAANNCWGVAPPGLALDGSHDYAIDWTPTEIVFSRDGVELGRTNCTIPTVPMHWVLQLVTVRQTPSAASFGHVYLDNLKIYKSA